MMCGLHLSCLALFYLVIVLSSLVSSRLVFSRLVLSCLVLSCLVLSCLVLSCLVLSCLVIFILACSGLVWSRDSLVSVLCCLGFCLSWLVLSLILSIVHPKMKDSGWNVLWIVSPANVWVLQYQQLALMPYVMRIVIVIVGNFVLHNNVIDIYIYKSCICTCICLALLSSLSLSLSCLVLSLSLSFSLSWSWFPYFSLYSGYNMCDIYCSCAFHSLGFYRICGSSSSSNLNPNPTLLTLTLTLT